MDSFKDAGTPRLERIQRSAIVPIEYSEVRKGMVIIGEDTQLYHVVDRNLNTPGNWRAILTLKLKNLKTGNVTEKRFKPDDKVETAYLEKREVEYIYKDSGGYVFMDVQTYDQITMDPEMVEELMLYLKPNTRAHLIMYEGKPLSLELPACVELQVVETEPSIKGATAQAQYKPATLERGLKITVPPFISLG